MTVNKYRHHVVLIPEDDANRQLANGFLLHSSLNGRVIDVRPVAGGWKKALDIFLSSYLDEMKELPYRHLILLVDFDNNFEDRKKLFEENVPNDIRDRFYLIGCLSEPERLRKNCNDSYETIGKSLAESCSNQTPGLWEDDELKHNENELIRLTKNVKPFLFLES